MRTHHEESRSCTRSVPCCIASTTAGWQLQGVGNAMLKRTARGALKILNNFVVQGPAAYRKLKANAGRDSTGVWKIPGAGGDPGCFGLKFDQNFKTPFDGTNLLNDAATAARGIG